MHLSYKNQKIPVQAQILEMLIVNRDYIPEQALERAIQSLEDQIIASLDIKIGFVENVSRALRIRYFTIHIG